MKAMNVKGWMIVSGLLIVVAAFAAATIATPAAETPGVTSGNLPGAFAGTAYEVTVAGGVPSAVTVPTASPVLRYVGRSVDGERLAYTTLDALEEGAPLHRRTVSSADVTKNDILVPTGDLFVENVRTRTALRVDLDGQYVVRATWSPTNPHELAYTFASDAGEFGLAISNVQTGKVTVVRDQGILADYLAWAPGGLEFYDRDGVRPGADSGFEVEHFRPTFFDQAGNVKNASVPFRELPTAEERVVGPQGFSFGLGSLTLTGDTLAGPGLLELRSATGTLIESFDAPVIEAFSAEGLLLKAIDSATGNDQLLFISPDGKVTSIMDLTQTNAATTSYYLAYSSGTKVTVTQSGSGYSPSCGLLDHTGALKYAYDFQSAAGDSDAILASASGTVAYFKKTITCNSLDTSGCADYRSTCTGSKSNHGFGNVVVIEHADNRYTAYAHLRYGTVKPTTTGVAVTRGCKLGNQGHTGATIGNRNGCGDHLHQQRQTGLSVVNGSSMALNFASLTNPLGCSLNRYTAGSAYKLCL